jgi:hypothetical protein
MAPIFIGLGLVIFGTYLHRRNRVPEDAIVASGSVTGIVERRSSLRRKRMLSGPVIAYDHPKTGKREELEPSAFYGHRPELGDTIEITYTPRSARIARVPRRWWENLFISAVGVVLVAVQIADWLL